MSRHDEIIVANEQFWEKMVDEGCGYTIPWLDLDAVLVRQYATGKLESVPDSLSEMYPANVLADVEGKDVLCLAAGRNNKYTWRESLRLWRGKETIPNGPRA